MGHKNCKMFGLYIPAEMNLRESVSCMCNVLSILSCIALWARD